MPQVIAAPIIGWLTPALGVTLATAAGNFLVSVAFTALSRALGPHPETPIAAGIATEVATQGERTGQSLVFGRYATAGNKVTPDMVSGKSGKVPNAYLTQVIDLGDMPVTGLAGVWLGEERLKLGDPMPAGGNFPGYWPVTEGIYQDRVWVKFYDGTQTAAPDSLIALVAQERPWTSEMIGRGIPYVIMRYKRDDEVFHSYPDPLFEVDGIKLYDPRKDTTAGGSGAHRWSNQATWEFSLNPAVMIYNILRGIDMPDGSFWGGRAEASDLPAANWFAAMNECDRVFEGKPQYRAGFEARIGPEVLNGHQPAMVIEELMKVCSAEIAEFGGTWRLRVGPPGLPVFVLTDDDIIITEDQTFEPFQGLADRHNGAHAQYPEPEEKWANKEAPPRYNADYEAEDQGQRKVASLQFAACPYGEQVQRLMRADIEDDRRQRRHEFTLPPDYEAVEVLDAGAYSSARNGYDAKVLELTGKRSDLRSLNQRMQFRERDPADYDWVAGYKLPTSLTPITFTPPAPDNVPDWAVSPEVVKDAAGKARKPAIRLSWDPDQPDAKGIAYQVRVIGRTELASEGTTQNVAAGGILVVDGVLSNADMEARGKVIADRKTLWTGWTSVHTADVRLGADDISAGLLDDFLANSDFLDGTNQLIADLNAEMDADITAVNTRITNETASLSGDIADLQQLALDNLGAAKSYTDTKVSTETTARNTALGALSARLDEVTAVNTSNNLLDNGDFSNGVTGWTGGVISEGGRGRLDGNQAVQTAAVTFSPNEVLQWRLEYQRPSDGGGMTFRVAFLNSSNAVIGAESVTTIPVTNGVQIASGTVAPPEGAVSVRVRVIKSGSQPGYIDNVAATKIDQQVIARIQALEVAQTTDQQATANRETLVNARFAANEASISDEATTRANADGALSTRVGNVESTTASQGARITTAETTLTTQQEALAQSQALTEAESGRRDLARDGTFARGMDYWPVGDLPATGRIIALNPASSNIRVSSVPAARYFNLAASDAASSWRRTDYLAITPGETVEVSFDYSRGSGSVTPAVRVVFYDRAKGVIGNAYELRGAVLSSGWQHASGTVQAPSDAVYAIVFFGVAVSGSSTAGITNVSALRTGAGYASRGAVETLTQAQVDDVAALAAYKLTVGARFDNVEAGTSANATAITKVYTKTQTDSAIATRVNALNADLTNRLGEKASASSVDAVANRVTQTENGLAATSDYVNTVNAKTDRGTASGKLRVFATSTPSGVDARLALAVETDANGSSHSAGFFMRANSNGSTAVEILASRFALITGSDGSGYATPFVLSGTDISMDASVWIKELSVGTDRVKVGAVNDVRTSSLTFNASRPSDVHIGGLNIAPYSTSSRLLVGLSGTLTLPASNTDAGLAPPSVSLRLVVNGTSRVVFRAKGDLFKAQESVNNYGGTTEYPCAVNDFPVVSGTNNVAVRIDSTNLAVANATFNGTLSVWEAKR